MGGKKVRVTVPESDGYIDLSAAQAAQHEVWRPLTIREANRLAKGRAKVSVDPEDARLWRVERPGSVEAHTPMTKLAWQTFLAEKVGDPVDDPADGGKELRDLVQDCLSPQAAAVIIQAVRQRLAAGIDDQGVTAQVRWFAEQFIQALGGQDGYELALKDVEHAGR
jgi:hypothetical protein